MAVAGCIGRIKVEQMGRRFAEIDAEPQIGPQSVPLEDQPRLELASHPSHRTLHCETSWPAP